VWFLNARRGRVQAEYLCYTTGEVSRREALDSEQRALLARVLDMPVDEAAVAAWSRCTVDEEPGKGADADGDRRVIAEFELLSRIGQGGMGVVYRAWQPSLGRQVALKCLLRQGDAKAEKRFHREIKALGRVEHPHLVKVFTSGSDGDQWFYAMELIEGADLGCISARLAGSTASEISEEQWTEAVSVACQQQRLREKRLSEESKREFSSSIKVVPAPVTPVGLGGRGHVAKVVELIRQVAGAAHALHEAGVIHRDIKPGNIMLTTDGRYAVLMDLGLAQLSDDTEGRLTRTRQFVGTLRYASPEQVLAVGDLDRRTDVYSLGATLWELLTLRPLFGADDKMPIPDLMLKIQSTDPEKVRVHNPRVPSDLQAIVRRCLDKDRNRRYATAAELAQDLARWQRGEVVLAQPPSLHYLLRKQIRRYRVTFTVTAAVLSTLVLVFLWAFVRVTIALGQKNHALQVEERAVKLTWDKLELLTSKALQTFLSQQATLTQPQKKFLHDALEGYTAFLDATGADEQGRARMARAYLRIGEIQRWLGQMAEAESAYHRSQDEYTRLVADFPNDSAYRRNLALSHRDLGLFLDVVRRRDEAEKEYGAALTIEQQLTADYPGEAAYREDLARTDNDLANLLHRAGRDPEAEAKYREALGLRKQLAADKPTNSDYQNDLATSYNNLGVLQVETNKHADAARQYQAAIAVLRPLVAKNADVPDYSFMLAKVSYNFAQLLTDDPKPFKDIAAEYRRDPQPFKDGEKYYRTALTVLEPLADNYPSVPAYGQELASSHRGLGRVLTLTAGAKEAEAEYSAALTIQRRLAARYSQTLKYQHLLAQLYQSLAELPGTPPQMAEQHYREAIAVQERLVTARPGVADYRNELAMLHYNLGRSLAASKRPKDEADQYQAAVALETKLVTDHPREPGYRKYLAYAEYRLGYLLQHALNDTDAAEKAYRAAITAAGALVSLDPASVMYRSNLAQMHHNLAVLLTTMHKTKDAEAEYQAALVLRQKLAADFPKEATYAADVGLSLLGLANLAVTRQDWGSERRLLEQAQQFYQTAVQSSPRNRFYALSYRVALRMLADVLIRLDAPAEAAATANRLAQLAAEPLHDFVEAARFLCRCATLVAMDGALLPRKRQDLVNQYDEWAVAMLRKAIAHGSDDIAQWSKDAVLSRLVVRHDFKELAALQKKPIVTQSLKPPSPPATKPPP
ncbi:MAG TPA: serine/threonine-protein kinase, partial [Gemmataceae bacterium]|nr:serine/threonine-protein kinase [Gemmataceae bacterium]